MTRALPVILVALSVLACTGAATEAPAPAPDPVVAAPEPHGKSKGGKGGKGGKAGRGERLARDPQPPIPATGTPDPLAGLDAAQICESNELLMVKYSFEELQGGRCAEVCCAAVGEEHWCCGLDWPFNDVPECDSYAHMRNGIFARYGYPFTDEKWKEAFADASYYRRREDFDAAWLTPVAKKNIDILKEKEDAHVGCTP